ncbi:PP2C family protein-serine/threonine phosphatase [Beggiatoa leptomitoformis]|uniref:SpoIIE family protein phosphatase n=1 Tax=Beggiatoa leptomitoformis TaxID=288004 RepID=A0A2N9YD22_9GAMM|nr:PP2C family protein-serine/threonine phosphatase [Beggiatoa leptomitoformis]AUI68351.1 SpoIIE family protein phosphatase [Beggiatoa leptomitoformis]QGX03865.1 SpoIIE family protein phosphatase [Beggiatoa leptomitoformis]
MLLNDFLPHGYCISWLPDLLALHVLSNGITALSYYAVAGAIVYFTHGRTDLPRKTQWLLIGTFVVFAVCGTTHILDIVVFWYPVYWVSGWLGMLNAGVSFYVFIFLLVPLIPYALEAPSPAKLAEANIALQAEIAERVRSEEKLRLSEQALREKTADLSSAYLEITDLNKQLSEENVRMGAELAVSRQLQQMVLPRPEELDEIEELDIASYMQPATEVAGDYYDILQEQGQVKIGIGDVTGHGLESGMVMLMVQTAVRTLLSSHIDDPKIFFNILNQVVYDNVKRMQSDKNLSLLFMDYQKGKLRLSGQHEEVLIVHQGGEVERIDTIDMGFLVGIERDITHFVTKLERDLDPGDGVVLYTDGLTEARNSQGKPYGVERLCKHISDNWHLPALEIRQSIVADIQEHVGLTKIVDDITFIVVKMRGYSHPLRA